MKNNTIIVGIAGASGSGKSLLSSTIVNELGSHKVAVISEDCYYKDQSHFPLEVRINTNYDHPSAFDHKLLIEHLNALKSGKSADTPTYDYSIHNRAQAINTISNTAIIILEGILIFAEAELRDLLDMRIYIDTPMDLCLLRRMRRDLIERGRTIDSVIKQYQKTVRPMFLEFIEPLKQYADIIVPRGGKNRVAIDIIKAKMREQLMETSYGN